MTYYFVETANRLHTCGHKHRSLAAAQKCQDKLMQPTESMRRLGEVASFWWKSQVVVCDNGSERFLTEDERFCV